MSANSRREQIIEMLKDEPNDSFLLYGLAMEHQSAGEEEQALKVFGDLMDSNPDYPPGICRLGSCSPGWAKRRKPEVCMKKAFKPLRKWGMAMLLEKWKVSCLFSIEFLLKSWSQILWSL